jgi:hypothetical protein
MRFMLHIEKERNEFLNKTEELGVDFSTNNRFWQLNWIKRIQMKLLPRIFRTKYPNYVLSLIRSG